MFIQTNTFAEGTHFQNDEEIVEDELMFTLYRNLILIIKYLIKFQLSNYTRFLLTRNSPVCLLPLVKKSCLKFVPLLF